MPHLKKWIDDNVSLKENVNRSDDILASVSHGIGFIAALAATVFLLLKSLGSSRAVLASLIYGISMCAVFASSSIYHGLKDSTAKRVMRLIDHSSIYVLIAGTYTPYSLAMGHQAGNSLLISVWSLCVIGLILNFLLWDRFKVLHIAVYLLMGWLVVFFWRPLTATAPAKQLLWMFAGGGLYTVGVFFYMYKKIPRSHFIWHLFVLGGAAGLYVGIAGYAIPSILAI